jgi:hypothetical protein
MDIGGRDVFDAFDEDFVRADPEAVGERSEDDGLVCGVPAVDVERGIGLRVPGPCASARAWAKSRPLSVMRVRM